VSCIAVGWFDQPVKGSVKRNDRYNKRDKLTKITSQSEGHDHNKSYMMRASAYMLHSVHQHETRCFAW